VNSFNRFSASKNHSKARFQGQNLNQPARYEKVTLATPRGETRPDLGTKALSLPMPVIRKKKFLAVRAFTAALLNRHRFENQTEQSEENSR